MKRLAVFVMVAAAAAACGTTDAPAGPGGLVTVAPARAVTVTISGVTSLFQRGQTAQLTAMAQLSNGFVENRTSSAQWQSSNAAVVSITNAGVVTAGNEGEAVIRATVEDTTGEYSLRVRYGIRTPDPPPGRLLPKPDESAFVASVIGSRPDLLARSCQPESGGNGTWELLDFVVDRLRERDLRWGYNGRRGVVSDVARDEVAYHAGAGSSENSRETYAWDILGGHCGPNPQPAWFDVSDLGTVWLTRGRF